MLSNTPIRLLFVQQELDKHNSYRAVLPALKNLVSQIHIVKHATSGKDALIAAKQLQPDIVLADWSYDDMNVVTLASKLTEVSPDLPIVAMAISFSVDMMRDGLLNGVDDFLNLPVNQNELLNVITLTLNSGENN